MGKKPKEPQRKIIRPSRDNITAEKAEGLNTKLFNLIDKGVYQLTVDFKNVKFVDPVGLSVIAAAHNTLSNVGEKMILKNIAEDISNIFDILGLNEHFEIE